MTRRLAPSWQTTTLRWGAFQQLSLRSVCRVGVSATPRPLCGLVRICRSDRTKPLAPLSDPVGWFHCTTCGVLAFSVPPERGVFVRQCAKCLLPLRTKAEAFLAKHPKKEKS